MPRSRNDLLRQPFRAACCTALLLLSAGCATTTSRTPPEAPRQNDPNTAAIRLDPSDIRLLAELLRMEDRRVLDSALVQRAMLSPHEAIRSRAVRAASRAGDRATTPMLRGLLTAAVDRVAADAAFALGEIGDTSSVNVQALRDVAIAGRGQRAVEATHALGKLVSQPAFDALVALLSPPATSSGASAPSTVLVREALLAIWQHGRQPALAATVIPHATSRDARIRWAATYALARVGRAASMPALLRAITDPDAGVRENAARGLRAALVDSANVRPAARTALIAALQDSSARVRINAVRALGAYRDTTAVAAIAALLRDADGNVRTSAVLGLADTGGAEAGSLLLRVAADASEAISVRAAALAAAVRLAPEQAIPIATTWTGSSTWLERMYGVRALAAAPWARTGPDLLRHTRDADPRVEAEALGAVAAANRADTTHALDALYVESLGSADPMVRATAIGALARHRDAVYVSALMDAYDRAQNDRENDAALAAINALGTFARDDSAVSRSFFFRFRRSSDPMVRSAVARSLGAGSWGNVLPASDRPVEYYEEIVTRLVAPVLAGGARPRAVIHSASGDITIELAAEDAPLTVNNFMTLASSGYFTSAPFRWHRVVPNFVLQDGDPRGDGSGGPGHSIRDEINRLRYTRGAVGMALSGPDTGGSQFFITHSPQPHLDGGYTVFGYVVSGMATADRVVQDESIRGIDIIR